MSKYLFNVICPACGMGKAGVFYHSCGGKRYIDEDLYLHCDKCNDSTFIMNSRFKCENHNVFRELDKMIFLRGLAGLASSNIPEGVMKNMIRALMEY